MKKIVSIITVALLAVVLVACGSKTGKLKDNEVAVAHTVSVTDGTKKDGKDVYVKQLVVDTFVKNPTRVATYALGVVDMLDTIGLDKVGITTLALPKSNLPESFSKFKSDTYPNAGTLFEPNYDVLDLMNPELIILDGRTSNLYSSLKKKYPNAGILDASNTTYSLFGHLEIVQNLRKIFAKVDADFKEEIGQIVHDMYEIKSLTKDAKALFVMSSGAEISTSGKNGRYGALHTDFGFQEADPNGQVGEAHGNATTLEYIVKVNPEVIFIMDRMAATGTGTSGLQNLLNEPQFKALDAAKSGNVFVLDGPSWYTVTGGFKATKQMILDIQQYINHVSK